MDDSLDYDALDDIFAELDGDLLQELEAQRPKNTKTAARAVLGATTPKQHTVNGHHLKANATSKGKSVHQPLQLAFDTDEALLQDIDWSDDEDIENEIKQAHSKKQAKSRPVNPEVEALRIQRRKPDYIPISRRYTRCIVDSVSQKILKQFRREKTLVVRVESSQESRRVILFDEWATSEVEPGNVINIIGPFENIPSSRTDNGDSLPDPVSELPTCILSYSNDNLLILHPDILVSATRAADAPFCRRKAVVQEKLRSTSDSSPALVYGNLLHELLQSCLLAMSLAHQDAPHDIQRMKEAFSLEKREKEIERLLKVPKNIEMLFMIGVELDQARHHLREKSVEYGEFADQFVGEVPKPDAYLSDPRIRDVDPAVSTRFCISSIHDIEEDIWSPRLGLKGKVDASVQASLIGPPTPFWPLGKLDDNVLPFEIKTGKSFGILQHRAQTMLYTQMMADRYDRPVSSGLLYYTQTNSVIRVEPVRSELRGLFIARNEMAKYLAPPPDILDADMQRLQASNSLPPSQPPQLFGTQAGQRIKDESEDTKRRLDPADLPSQEEDELWAALDEINGEDLQSQSQNLAARPRRPLPPVIDEERSCKKCYAVDGCMLYRKAIDKVDFISEDSEDTLQQLYADKTSHLTPMHCDFFGKWERLISLEEKEIARFKKEIWSMQASEREKHGRCLNNMVLDSAYKEEGPVQKIASPSAAAERVGIHRYSYRMIRARQSQCLPALNTQDPFFHTQSSQPTSQASSLNLGGQLSVGDPVVISVEPSILGLARGFVLEVKAESITMGLDHSLTTLPGDRYHEDPYSPHNETADVIYRIDKDELQAGLGRIRDNLAQLFFANGDEKRRRLIVDLEKPKFDKDYKLSIGEKEKSNLNIDQVKAVNKVLTAQDYALILGMPGTGKTTTVAQVIKALTDRGKTVLLTSYTHSAVDNILLKIKDLDIGILRLGNVDKIMPCLSHLTLAGKEPATSISQLEQRYFSPQVVATTALSIDHPLFSRRKFDYCIVDEASQITLPTCLGPLRFAETFILVGDHNQLPPLVKNPSARLEGLEVSLFRRLSEAHPSSVVYLSHQYRMNSDIMSLSNRLIYHGRLKCGNEEVAKRGLHVPSPEHVRRLCRHSQQEKPCWLQDLLDAKRKVVFVDTDALPARESKSGRLVQNEGEAQLVYQLGKALLAAGVQEDQLGVIALYRQQIKLLAQTFDQEKGVEILTADKSQGRDKDCILMALTRSNADKQVGDLLKDWRRLNVCFTRAKKKLVIFGSRSTLSSIPLLAKFFELIDEQDWYFSLPASALTDHTTTYTSCTRIDKASPPASAPARICYDNSGPLRRLDANVSSPTNKPLSRKRDYPDIPGIKEESFTRRLPSCTPLAVVRSNSQPSLRATTLSLVNQVGCETEGDAADKGIKRARHELKSGKIVKGILSGRPVLRDVVCNSQ